jgi:3-phosphoshikimate 1-carboxyvinyltransferase
MSAPAKEYPDALEIVPLRQPPLATIRVPGSKSITNRALILAALSDPMKGSELRGVLQSEDTEVMVEALRQLGFRVDVDWANAVIRVRRGPCTKLIPNPEADLFVANSGTSMRFLTALVSLGQGRYRLDGVARMRERPIEDLLVALRQLGADARSELDNGYPPVVVNSSGLEGGFVRLRGEVSSQFLSALLMVAPFARRDLTIDVTGPLVSKSYVAMTVKMMEECGVRLSALKTYFKVAAPQPWYRATAFEIEPDASAAGYFLAAAAITAGEVTVPGFDAACLQGDVRFVAILESMGCDAVYGDQGVTLCGKPLCGVDVDMNDVSDCVMTLAAVACFAKGPTTIRDVAHIRHKETDRLRALATELRRVGAEVEERPDGLTITPGRLHGATIETYNDHRMAMGMALIGLRVPGIVIRNPGCVAKTYPDFFDDLERLRVNMRG